MKKGSWLIVIGIVLMCRVREVQAQSLQQSYQTAMVNYRQAQAKFDRDRQLYQSGNEEFQTVMNSANNAFATRQTAMLSYIDYLQAIVNSYISNDAVRMEMSSKLDTHRMTIASLPVSFATLADWSAADAQTTSALASLTETVYQSFAQIYWGELNDIIQNYTTLYQNQNQRILNEAASGIERENKARTLQETERTLQTLQTQITEAAKNLSWVNSQASYTNLRDNLNQILATLETSLKAYAELE